MAALEASGQTNPSESVERGRQAFLAKVFSQYPPPPPDLILIFSTAGALVLKMAIYCPQGSGTLRQQILRMHDMAW